MKAIVCISHVPDTTTKIQIDPSGVSINTTGVTFVINPYDEFALSRALEFREANVLTQVDVLCVGGADVEPTLRKALAVGADAAVRIDGSATDAYYIARQIAEYVKANPYEFVMFGKESIDFNGSEVPGMVAEMLDIPFVSFATKLELNGDKAIIEREVDGGTEVLESSLPLALSAQKGMAEWRIPNMRGIMAARTKPLKAVPAAASPAHTVTAKLTLPPPKAGCEFIEPENMGRLVQILADKGVL